LRILLRSLTPISSPSDFARAAVAPIFRKPRHSH
jgi:hypothetical protein